MITLAVNLGAVYTHTHTHTHKYFTKIRNGLINNKIVNINIHNQTGILCLYEDTG